MINKNTKNMNESMFSAIDLIRQDSKDVRDFVKKVFSDKEFKSMSKDTDFIKYLKSIYEGTMLDEEHVKFSNRTQNGTIATGSVQTANEAVLRGRDYQYDKKQGVVRISKKNFSKVHKDGKLVKNGKSFMMVLTDKGTSLVPAQFESSVNEDGTPCWDTHKVGNPKTKVSSKTGKRVNNCVPKGESVNEASIKGKNNKTGESFGMVIGSDKKNKQGEFEVTIRITYSSRISSYKFMFDKSSNLIAIKDYGYSMDGKFPDMKGGGSVKTVKPNPRETITQIAKITSPAFAKKIYQHVNKVNESVNEGKYNYKADALTAYFKGKIDAKELDKIARDDFKSGIATKKELSNFLSNKFTQDVMSDTYGIPAGTLVKRVRGLMKFAEGIGESVVNEATPFHVLFKVKKDISNRSIKPATASYKSESDAKKFLKSVKKDGGKGMIVRRNENSTEDGVPQGYNPMVEDKSEIKGLLKKVGNKETKFYDVLSAMEKKYGKSKYRTWLEKSLKDFGVNSKHYDYRTNGAAEEKLFQLGKK